MEQFHHRYPYLANSQGQTPTGCASPGQQTTPGGSRGHRNRGGRGASWTRLAPGGLVSVWYSPYAVSRSWWSDGGVGLTPSPETATSGQSPHVSYGYTKP